MNRLICLLLLLVAGAAHADTAITELLEFQPDIDGNGVRDDIDNQLSSLFSNNSQKLAIATKYALTIQNIARSQGAPEHARELVLTKHTLDVCWMDIGSEFIEPIVIPLVLSTYGVSRRYLEVRLMVQQTYGSLDSEEREAFVDKNRGDICP